MASMFDPLGLQPQPGVEVADQVVERHDATTFNGARLLNRPTVSSTVRASFAMLFTAGW